MNPVKVTSSADQPPRLQIAWVPEDEALANLHASHAPVRAAHRISASKIY